VKILAKKIDIAQIFIWASNVLDTNQLTLAEHATLFNLIKLINRNFWKPIKISAFKLSRQMCSDKRTIEKAFKSLAEKKIIYIQEGVIFLGYVDEKTFKSLISQSTDGGHNGKAISPKILNADRRADTTGTLSTGETTTTDGATAETDTEDDEPKSLADF